jgi:hypothetical protein
MKRFTTLALVIFALAAVPSAFADDGSAPAQPAQESTAPAAQQSPQRPVRPVQDPTATTTAATAPAERQRPAERVHNLGARVQAWARHCVARTGAAPERCLERIKTILERLGKLDDKLQARIAKIEEACGASSTEDRCKNADKRVERLTKLDARVQTVIEKAQAWLDGKGTPPADPESALDDAAQNLGQLTGSNG